MKAPLLSKYTNQSAPPFILLLHVTTAKTVTSTAIKTSLHNCLQSQYLHTTKSINKVRTKGQTHSSMQQKG